MMEAVGANLQCLPHAVFLHRTADGWAGGSESPRTQSRVAQGAFLVLRLIDQLALAPGPRFAEAFRYQWAATERFCRDLQAGSTEGAHVHGLAVSAMAAATKSSVSLLSPSLFAYAHYLEDGLRLEEALDVLVTLLNLTADATTSADRVALFLRLGRVNRKMNRFDDAESAYAKAGEAARTAGDQHGELLSRIGAASTLRYRGNLPEAERRLNEILTEAQARRLRDAEARAEHDLAVVQQDRGSPDVALVHAWRAFELYEDEQSRMRALNDVGVMLLTLGDAVGAERALTEVLRRGAAKDTTTPSNIELMHAAAFRRDRMAFERQRSRCEELKATMPPNVLADYHLKVGIGEARFANFRRAAKSLERALTVAKEARLHALEFKIERIKSGLSACENLVRGDVQECRFAVLVESEDVRRVSASVADLVGETA